MSHEGTYCFYRGCPCGWSCRSPGSISGTLECILKPCGRVCVGRGRRRVHSGFADAFLTMPLLEKERQYVVVKESAIGTLCVGGRVRAHPWEPLFCTLLAAAVARLTPETFLPWEAQLQYYVGDPGLSIAGCSRRERLDIVAGAVSFCCITGILVNRKEPRPGRRLDWIGFEFHVRPAGFDVTVSQDKINVILKEFQEFEAAPGTCSRQKLASTAGVMVWMPSVVL